LAIQRKVEVFAIEESSSTKKTTRTGGREETETTYTYSETWVSELQDSSNFEESQEITNPSEKPFSDETIFAKSVDIRGLQFSPSQANLTGFVNLILTSENVNLSNFETSDNQSQQLDQADPFIKGKYIFSSQTAISNPEVGD